MDQVTHPDIARAEWDQLSQRFADYMGGKARVIQEAESGGVAHRHGVPKHRIAAMAGNLGIDWLIGLVPLLGDIFDIGWKANSRNARILREHSQLAKTTEAPMMHEKSRAQRDAA